MKLIYQNYIGENYQKFLCSVNDTVEYFIGSSLEIDPNKLSTVTIYDSTDMEDKMPIYAEFALSKTDEQILNFFNKYGSIISPSLVPVYDIDTRGFLSADTLQKLPNIFDSNQPFFYECISVNHFKYYHFEMDTLISIQQLLAQGDLNSPSDLKLLATHCCNLVQNPYFETMFYFEYSDAYDTRKYIDYFSSNPYIQCVFGLSTRQSKIDKDKIKFLLPDASKDTLLSKLLNEEFHEKDYIQNKTGIIDLAKYLFANALSFEIRNAHPKITYDNTNLLQDWQFFSLLNAIFFSFYLDYSPSKVIARCANEKCGKIFTFAQSRRNKKYCCAECAHRVANRNYKQRRKELKKTTSSIK